MAADQRFSPRKRTSLFERERRDQGVVEVQQCFESAGGFSRWEPRGYWRLQPGQQRLGAGKFLMSALKGHGFSHALENPGMRALAPEGKRLPPVADVGV